MTTALAIITAALQDVGVVAAGSLPAAEDSADCLARLNLLADAWLTEPNYAFTTTTVTATITAGTQSATIGPSMTFNCARPTRLEDGCFVRYAGLDYPLGVIGQAEYNAKTLKSLNGPWPQYVYYDTGSPTGLVYFYPAGPGTINLVVQTPVSSFATLATSVTLVPGYERAFRMTLAEDVADAYARQVTPKYARMAAMARRTIKRLNFSVPQLAMGDRDIGGFWRIYAG